MGGGRPRGQGCPEYFGLGGRGCGLGGRGCGGSVVGCVVAIVRAHRHGKVQLAVLVVHLDQSGLLVARSAVARGGLRVHLHRRPAHEQGPGRRVGDRRARAKLTRYSAWVFPSRF